MPCYEFKCPTCGYVTERIITKSFDTEEECEKFIEENNIKCPECAVALRRQIGSGHAMRINFAPFH